MWQNSRRQYDRFARSDRSSRSLCHQSCLQLLVVYLYVIFPFSTSFSTFSQLSLIDFDDNSFNGSIFATNHHWNRTTLGQQQSGHHACSGEAARSRRMEMEVGWNRSGSERAWSDQRLRCRLVYHSSFRESDSLQPQFAFSCCRNFELFLLFPPTITSIASWQRRRDS